MIKTKHNNRIATWRKENRYKKVDIIENIDTIQIDVMIMEVF